jgi:hypothetical protein
MKSEWMKWTGHVVLTGERRNAEFYLENKNKEPIFEKNG